MYLKDGIFAQICYGPTGFLRVVFKGSSTGEIREEHPSGSGHNVSFEDSILPVFHSSPRGRIQDRAVAHLA